MTRWLLAAQQAIGQSVKGADAQYGAREGAGDAAAGGVLSVLSVVSEQENRLSLSGTTAQPALADQRDIAPDAFAHGQGITGDPRTWTGRVVSLAEWRRLSAWDRHGPNGRWFYGDTWQWEPPRGGK